MTIGVIAMNNQEYTLFGKPIERLEKPFCEKCSELLKDEKYQLCYNCGKEQDTLYFGRVRALGIYRPKSKDGNYLSRMIKQFKYDLTMHESIRWRIAEEFASLLYRYVLDEPEIVSDVDFCVPVPMTKEKEDKKGFNHVRMITEKFSKNVEIRVEYDNLVKIKETKPQTNLKRFERHENVKGVFDVLNPNKFKGKKVLLIDDVVTTCSTANECAKVLRNAGAQEVNVLALARDTR